MALVTRRTAQLDRMPARPLAADRYVLTATDEFFFALEGRTLEANSRTWTIEVCGVHSTGAQHWVQLQLCGPVAQEVTLRVPRLDAGEVVALVTRWLAGVLPAALESAVVGRAYLPAPTN